MTSKLDYNVIRGLTPPELTSHFSRLLGQYPNSEQEISTQLLHLVEREAFPPTVFIAWLYIANSSKTVLQALKQEFSIYIRALAINRLARVLQSKGWRQVWDEVGGTAWFLSLLAQFSAAHVEKFLVRMSRRIKGPKDEERGERIAELLQSLLPSVFPDASLKTSDERRFIDGSGYSLYANLLPACDSEFISTVIGDNSKAPLHNPKIIGPLKSYPQFKLLPLEWRGAMTRGQRRLLDPIEPLILSIPLSPSSMPGISDAMVFQMELLRKLTLQKDIELDEKLDVLATTILPLLKRAWSRRRRIQIQNLEEVFTCCFNFLITHPEDRRHFTFERGTFLYYVLRGWDCSLPERPFFEDCLVSILRKMWYESGSVWTYAKYFISWVDLSKRYRLLRIYLMHYGQKNIDLDRDEDLMALEKSHRDIIGSPTHHHIAD
jgi:hypothetical protein